MKKGKKLAVAGLCSLMLGLGISQPTAASTFAQCNSYINIHSDPYIESPIVGYIYNDNIVNVAEIGDYGWMKIQSGKVTGWVDQQYFVEDEYDSRGYTVAKVNSDALYVRLNPNMDSEIYTTLYKGDEVECTKHNGDWYVVALEDGFFGYVKAEYVELRTYHGTAVLVEEIVPVEPVYYDETPAEETYDVVYQSSPEEYYNDYDEQEQEEYADAGYDEDWTEPEEDYDYDYDYSDDNEDVNYDETEEEEYYQDDSYEKPEYESYEPTSANSDIVSYADSFVGNPYVWGGNSLTNGVDCSHFVWNVLKDTGHYDGDYAVSDGWASLGDSVSSLDDAVAGDVIVYPGHVAIYDGDGGLVEAKGSAYGITHDRNADYNTILAIRHFD